ncbi:taste receptor type 2 member 4-like [Ranitomeya variabilis]|uniref:taste receptor type 2 member 4-like n=1 Tax=Ranitomeya variabilis TaxID=490064 RepID=UPI0040563825
MASAVLIGVTAAEILQYVVGIALNMYILLIYKGNLKNGVSLGPSDIIHFTKALLNVSMLVVMLLQNVLYFWPFLFYIKGVLFFFMFSSLFVVAYNSWLTALLCVYYCTNIITWGHRVFAWLKRSLSSYLLRILLVSGLGSAAICSPVFWLTGTESAGNSTHQSTFSQRTIHPHTTYRIISTTLGSILPFSIAFISTTLTSWSLINHIWRMKQNNSHSKLQTQINATRTMILFLLSSIIYNVTLYFFFTAAPGTFSVDAIIIWIVIMSYLISEAIIIIQSNVKLRKTLVRKFFVRASSNREVGT